MLINGSATLTFRTALYLWLYEVYASLRTKPEPKRTQHAYLKTPHYKTLADQQYRTGW